MDLPPSTVPPTSSGSNETLAKPSAATTSASGRNIIGSKECAANPFSYCVKIRFFGAVAVVAAVPLLLLSWLRSDPPADNLTSPPAPLPAGAKNSRWKSFMVASRACFSFVGTCRGWGFLMERRLFFLVQLLPRLLAV